MNGSSRRRVLALAGSSLAVSLAGCTEAAQQYLGSETEGEFLVVNSGLSHSPGYRIEHAKYPDDIVARVTIENGRPRRAQGRLEIELRYEPDDGEPKVWTKTDGLDEPGGFSHTPTYVFKDAYQPGSEVPEDYEISAEIVELDDVPAA